MSSLLSSLLLQIHSSVRTPELDRYAELQHIQRSSSQVFVKYINWAIVKVFHSSAMEILDMKLPMQCLCWCWCKRRFGTEHRLQHSATLSCNYVMTTIVFTQLRIFLFRGGSVRLSSGVGALHQHRLNPCGESRYFQFTSCSVFFLSVFSTQFSCFAEQVIQTVGAVDEDQPPVGQRFFFKSSKELRNRNFTVRDYGSKSKSSGY